MADTGIANRLLRQRRPMESALGRWLEGNALGKAPSSSCSSFDLVNLENKFMLDIFCRHKLETESTKWSAWQLEEHPAGA